MLSKISIRFFGFTFALILVLSSPAPSAAQTAAERSLYARGELL